MDTIDHDGHKFFLSIGKDIIDQPLELRDPFNIEPVLCYHIGQASKDLVDSFLISLLDLCLVITDIVKLLLLKLPIYSIGVLHN